MNRLRAFDFPHKALRSILSRFTFMAGTIDHSNPKEVEELKTLGNEMFELLENHLYHEESNTFHHIESKKPGGCKFELDDHQKVEEVQHALQKKLNEPIHNGHDFYLEACKFQAVYLEHINHEETVTEKILWELFTDEELIGHRMEILKAIEPAMMMLWLKYGIPASTIADSIAMLKGFKQGAPAEAFNAAIEVTKDEMPADKFALLESGLN
jgi:hypothetical protein